MIHCYELFWGRANKNSSYFREGRVVGFRKRKFWSYPGYLFGRFPLLGHLAFCYFWWGPWGWFRHMSGRWSIGDDLWISSWAHQQRFHLSWYQATKVPSGLRAATDIDMFGFSPFFPMFLLGLYDNIGMFFSVNKRVPLWNSLKPLSKQNQNGRISSYAFSHVRYPSVYLPSNPVGL